MFENICVKKFGYNIFFVSLYNVGQTVVFSTLFIYNTQIDSDRKDNIHMGDKVDILHYLEVNRYNGLEKIQLNVNFSYF